MKITILILTIMLTSCSSCFYVSKTNLPSSGGSYVFHGKTSSYPLVTDATISNDTISGKVSFSDTKGKSDQKYHVYVYNDSLIKVNSDVITVPLENVKKISIQMAPYSVLKKEFDPHSYSFEHGDHYNPPIAGFASLIVPGLGQTITGEPGRGFFFFAGYIGCLAATIAELDHRSDYYEGDAVTRTRTHITQAFLLSAIAINIWSVVDAAKVAKVKNLARRNNISYDLNLKPFYFTNGPGVKPIPIGLSFRMTF